MSVYQFRDTDYSGTEEAELCQAAPPFVSLEYYSVLSVKLRYTTVPS